VGSFVSARLIVRVKRYKRVPAGGLVLGMVGLAAFAARPEMPIAEVCLWLTVCGAGLGAMYPVTTTLVQNAVAPHQLGIATGALNFARQLGGAITVAAFGAIVLGGISTGGQGLTLEMLRGGASLAGADFAQVFRWLFAAGAALLAAGLVAVMLVEERPFRGPGRSDAPPDVGA